MFRRKLLSLSYPDVDIFKVQDQRQFRTLVVWLEETKIRALAINDRAGLRAIDSPSWETQFRQYLQLLECPREYTKPLAGETLAVVCDWFLGQAVSAEYADNALEFNKADKMKLLSQSPSLALKALPNDPSQANIECSGEEFVSIVNELAATLNMPAAASEEEAAQLLTVIRQRIEKAKQRRADEEHESKAQSTLVIGDKRKTLDVGAALGVLDAYPLGFSTGDQAVDRAGRILRLLHLHDLRDLQTLINEVIVSVQEFTADPKTDSRLGKVGKG
eukprot:CAMPEP_0175131368 /NCGR_PEP_ID=MMETSP0087-20121206/6503_1 /TAXON_ID=136419 /ORGANISM="Unknown Unknown, Strain D1" /LENGTH=274 /DNA_ID=CAMNT_0016413649 /DNA_START=15 /DNA_END=839 /DNA_ORIENTATION=-